MGVQVGPEYALDPASHGTGRFRNKHYAEENQLQALPAIVAAVEPNGRHIRR
jgi:hypothetical protein